MKHDNPPDPEALYNVYKDTRAVSSDSAAKDVPVGITDITADDNIADLVYKRYQQTRSGASTDIDEIMRVISAGKSTAESHQLEDQPDSLSAAPDIQKIDNSVGRFGWLNKLSGAGNDGYAGWGKVIFPAVAAAVFAFLLVPFVTSKNNNNDSVAHTTQLPPELERYIAPASSQMLGFSDQDNAHNVSFQYGVLATDLHVLRNGAGSPELLKSVVQSYLLDETTLPEAIVIAAKQVVSLNAPGSAEMATGIDNLLTAMNEQVSANNHGDWYMLGASIESIVLSAQHALATSDTSILQVAFKEFSGNTVPEQDKGLKKLVDDLLYDNITDSMEPSDVRRILKKASDIKSVTQ